MRDMSVRCGVRGGAGGWDTALQDEGCACSITDVVSVIFYLINPSGRTMALGSTQPLTEMSTRDLPRG
jgi:hypothetical protein